MTGFSRAWKYRGETRSAQRDRKWLKAQRSRKARRLARRDPYAAVPRLSAYDVT